MPRCFCNAVTKFRGGPLTFEGGGVEDLRKKFPANPLQ